MQPSLPEAEQAVMLCGVHNQLREGGYVLLVQDKFIGV